MKLHTLDEVAAQLNLPMADPVRWLTKQINHGPFTARRVGRSLCMTDEDMSHALEAMRVGGVQVPRIVPKSGPSEVSARRRGLRSAS